MKELEWRTLLAIEMLALFGFGFVAIATAGWKGGGGPFLAEEGFPLSLAIVLTSYRVFTRESFWTPFRSLSGFLQMGIAFGLVYSAGITLTPALVEMTVRHIDLFDWHGNKAWGWFVLGAINVGLAAWATIIGTSNHRTSILRNRVWWAATGVVAHILLATFGFFVAPNETGLVFASIYVIIPCAILLLLEIDWSRILRRDRSTQVEPDPANM